MISDKKSVQILVSLCEQYNIKNVVFSPGSRNAPLTISFNENNFFNCISIVDERSAAFYALGMAQQLNEPVIICCTSGSASLNYAPAISEAYYQNIPLIVLTADRPSKWLHQDEGQMINQVGIYNNIIHHNYELQISESDKNLSEINLTVNKALSQAKAITKNTVHINIPFEEPLYNTLAEKSGLKGKLKAIVCPKNEISINEIDKISTAWGKSKNILILCGILNKDEELNNVLKLINQNPSVAILTESTANLNDLKFISSIDRTLAIIPSNEELNFAPDLLITIGGAIISKKIKALLRKYKPKEHWQIGNNKDDVNTFEALTKNINISPFQFFNKMLNSPISFDSLYGDNWLQAFFLAKEKHELFLNSCNWSDLKATEIIIDTLPDFVNLHLGNSSPVRYVQLFEQISTIKYNSNRGVSGIDGCTSTMVGAASINESLTVLLTGDLSFVYDINALWNNHLTENIRIIVINNSGGGIFRIIPGPDTTNQLERFFEVGNNAKIKKLVEAHNINYYAANDIASLDLIIPEFYNQQQNKRPAVLEIFTPKETNPIELKRYFEFIGKK